MMPASQREMACDAAGNADPGTDCSWDGTTCSRAGSDSDSGTESGSEPGSESGSDSGGSGCSANTSPSVCSSVAGCVWDISASSGSSDEDTDALGTGAIVGIIAGVMCVCGVGGGLVAFFMMQNSDDNQKGAGPNALDFSSSITNTGVYDGAAVEGEGYLEVGADLAVGDRVSVEGKGAGIVRFVGPHAENGKPRVGVELDDAIGKNNGTVKGHKYFTCKDNHGSLVAPGKVTAEVVKPGDALPEGAYQSPQ
jgi:hypothetical protein